MNKPSYMRKAKEHRRRIKERFIEYKKTLQCNKCGDKRWYVLEFHHSDPSKKKMNVSSIQDSWNVQMKEIEKCTVLCANCHREEEYLTNPLWIKHAPH